MCAGTEYRITESVGIFQQYPASRVLRILASFHPCPIHILPLETWFEIIRRYPIPIRNLFYCQSWPGCLITNENQVGRLKKTQPKQPTSGVGNKSGELKGVILRLR
jgi:hypothetical protein